MLKVLLDEDEWEWVEQILMTTNLDLKNELFKLVADAVHKRTGLGSGHAVGALNCAIQGMTYEQYLYQAGEPPQHLRKDVGGWYILSECCGKKIYVGVPASIRMVIPIEDEGESISSTELALMHGPFFDEHPEGVSNGPL